MITDCYFDTPTTYDGQPAISHLDNFEFSHSRCVSTISATPIPIATISGTIDIASSSAIAQAVGDYMNLSFVFWLFILLVLFFGMARGFFKW